MAPHIKLTAEDDPSTNNHGLKLGREDSKSWRFQGKSTKTTSSAKKQRKNLEGSKIGHSTIPMLKFICLKYRTSSTG